MSFEEEIGPFLDHFEELRKVLVQCLCIIALGCLFSFAFYRPIVEWFSSPYHNLPSTEEVLVSSRVINKSTNDMLYAIPPESENIQFFGDILEESFGNYRLSPGASLKFSFYRNPKQSLIVLGPLEGISIALKVALWMGVLVTAPAWGLCLARFIAPGLRKNEKKIALIFLLFSFVFMSLGVIFAYQVTIPLANQYLTQFNLGIGENFWSLRNYLDYTLFLLTANAIAFECGVIGLFAVHYRVISADFLIEYRKHAIVLAFILGALLTPPDIATQVLMAIPLILLYEAVIFYAKILRFRVAHVN